MILVLRALGIGDLCAGVPALRGLRAAYPREQLVLAAPAWLGPLVALTGAVDRLLSQEELAPPRWSLPAPRLAVNLHGRGPRSHRLLATARPQRLLGYLCPDFPDGPQWSDVEHEVRRWCRLLWWYGVPADPADLRLAAPAATGALSGATVVHPGAKAPARRWPAPRFGAVARALAAAGHRVVVTGSPAERPLARSVAAYAGLPDQAVLAGRLDLAGLAALVAGARLVVCGDTGVGHLATAYGTPSVLLFGPAPPAAWGPPDGRGRHRVIWHGDVVAAEAELPPDPAAAPEAEPAAGPEAGTANEPAAAAMEPRPALAAVTAAEPHPALAAVTVDEVLAEATALGALPTAERRRAAAPL